MESRSSSRSASFWLLAVERGLLTEEVARALEQEASSSDLRPGELVLRKALLDPVQVDIVETLLRPHDIVPGYELQDVLGHGGMGVVYRARQKNLDRTVALKTILINRMLDSKAAARFEQEAIAIGRLQHPHIVNAFDFGRHEGRLYLAMEFVRGKDLEQLITHEDELEENLVLALGRQAVLGLAYASRTGVVHRDIKPANLMLDQSGDLDLSDVPTVKIADFGLAFLTDDSESRTRLTADNAAVGSPHYIAPEQLQQSHVDFRADIYALGATLFHALTGHAPFTGKSVLQIATAKVSGVHPRVSESRNEVSKETDELIAWMMEPDPAKRPADYKELLNRIDQILARSPTQELAALSSVAVVRDSMAGTQAAEKLETTEVVNPKRTFFCWNRWLVTGLFIIVLGVVGWGFLPQDFWRPLRPLYQRTSHSVPLYNGTALDLSIWQPEAGGIWRDAVNEEQAKVIEGKGAAFVRLIHPAKQGEGTVAVPNHELTFMTQLHEAREVEVTFGIPTKGGTARALRLTPGHVELGTIPFPNGVFRTSQVLLIPEGDSGSFHVQIDQEENRCWIKIDDLMIPGFYLSGKEFQPRIRLRTVGGAAWFSDFELTELVPRSKAVP